MSVSSFAARKVSVGLPVIATIVLALVTGALQTVSQVLLTKHPQEQAIVVVILTFLAFEGINPAIGSAFVALLRLPPWLFHLIKGLVTAVAGITQILSLSHGWHIAIVDALTILAALGLGPQSPEPPAPLLASGVPPGGAGATATETGHIATAS